MSSAPRMGIDMIPTHQIRREINSIISNLMDSKHYIQLTTSVEFTRNKNGNRNTTLNYYPNPETETQRNMKKQEKKN